jgi:hypothetical protein
VWQELPNMNQMLTEPDYRELIMGIACFGESSGNGTASIAKNELNHFKIIL